MKTNSTHSKKAFAILWLSCATFFWSVPALAQVCASPATVIYGMNGSGQIFPITVTNASVGAAVNTSVTGSPNSSNALGYNGINGKFYFFNTNFSPAQFVSYYKLTNTYAVLAVCPLTTTVRSGCVASDGKGYYCLDQNANLFYYNIALNTWTKITSTFYDQTATDITNTVKAQSSGDMAIDGAGNLYLLLSGTSNYGLYKINAPMPTTAVASITARQIIAPTTPTPDGSTIAGIAFSSPGLIYLATINDHLYVMNNNLTTTLLGTFSVSGVGTDLTSCNFPFGALAINFINFTAGVVDESSVDLNWSVAQQSNNMLYHIEHSMDNVHWEILGRIQNTGNTNLGNYSFQNSNVLDGIHYYRIGKIESDGSVSYSEVAKVTVKGDKKISIWPNPATSFIRVQNYENGTVKFRVFDPAGRTVKEAILTYGINTIDISKLPSGAYLAIMQKAGGNSSLKFIKE
jgi:hypothetical protein